MTITILLIIIYQLLQLIFFPCIALFILCIHFKRSVIGSFKERFGFVPAADRNKHVIWIHAVSVGEVLSVQELINFIKQSNPNTACYLTVGTLSGKQMAQRNITTDAISFLPYDFLPYMLMAYHRIKPKALIVVEAELWPNLLGIGTLKKIPMFLLNARINPRSHNRVIGLKALYRVLINCFTTIFAQSNHDRDIFQQIGIDPNKIKVLGNLKAFNVVMKKEHYADHATTQPAHYTQNTVMLVGSMHPGEDKIYLDLFVTLKKEFPKLKLILAPRHFAWQQELETRVKKYQLSFFTWDNKQSLTMNPQESQTQALERIFMHHDVILVCKLGELFALHAYADLYFLGGTFIPVGGHNLLEPAVWGIPTVIGPHYHNCKDIADRLEAVNGIIKTATPAELLEQTRYLLQHPKERRVIGTTSYEWVVQESQTVTTTLHKLIEVLK